MVIMDSEIYLSGWILFIKILHNITFNWYENKLTRHMTTGAQVGSTIQEYTAIQHLVLNISNRAKDNIHAMVIDGGQLQK